MNSFAWWLQSFEALNQRAVAVVVDPIQSVKGKVVIDAFRWASTGPWLSHLFLSCSPPASAATCSSILVENKSLQCVTMFSKVSKNVEQVGRDGSRLLTQHWDVSAMPLSDEHFNNRCHFVTCFASTLVVLPDLMLNRFRPAQETMVAGC